MILAVGAPPLVTQLAVVVMGAAAGDAEASDSTLFGQLVEMVAQEAQTISPAAGQESLRASVIAGLLGLALRLLGNRFRLRQPSQPALFPLQADGHDGPAGDVVAQFAEKRPFLVFAVEILDQGAVEGRDRERDGFGQVPGGEGERARERPAEPLPRGDGAAARGVRRIAGQRQPAVVLRRLDGLDEQIQLDPIAWYRRPYD